MLHDMNPDTKIICSGIQNSGQPCTNKAIPGVPNCAMCGGNKQLEKKKNENLRTYRLAKFQARAFEMAESPRAKSLADEVGILRMLLEEQLKNCKTPLEMLSHVHSISDLALKIEKLVTSCHRLDKSLHNYLDKNQIIQLGAEIVQIVSKHAEEEVVEKICTDLEAVIERMLNEEKTSSDD